MTGDTETARDVEEGQRRLLLSLLHPGTGLVYAPDKSDRNKGLYYYHVWDQGRTLRALVRWHETSPGDRPILEPLARRMIEGFSRFATIRGADAVWGEYAGWPSDEFINSIPGSPFIGYFCNSRAGVCLEPLVRWAELTGDRRALDLAVRFANCELGGHQGDAVPEKRAYFEFGPDGSFTGHLHSKTATLIGIAKLARHLGTQGRLREAAQYLRRVRQIYDWIYAHDNPHRGSRIGWIPERPGARVCETCCHADMIELAEALASCSTLTSEFGSWAGLHDDVEALTVNMIARTQIRFTPEFERFLESQYHGAASLTTARLFEGTWPAIFQPNDLVQGDLAGEAAGAERPEKHLELPLWGCCRYAGVSALHAGWRDAMVYDEGTLRVNFFLNRESPEAVMQTRLPSAGEAALELRKPTRVLVRVPAWLEAPEMVLEAGARRVRAADILDPTQRYADLGGLAASTRIDVRFPTSERVTEERIGAQNYTVRWRGNYVSGMRPSGRYLPIFPPAKT
jgi:hypothetical protein